MAAMAELQPAATDFEPWAQNLSSVLICPDCKEDPPNLVEERSAGDMVCESCGLVVGARIVDTTSEWRTFSNDDQNNDDPSRVGDGPNLLLNGDQLSTEVGMGDSKHAKDLRRAQNKTNLDKGNKALNAAYKQIQAYCDQMNLPSTVSNHTKTLYKDLQDEKERNVVKNKPLEVVAASLIFIACREFQVPRTFREVHKITSVSKKEIGKVFKVLMEWRQKKDDQALKTTGVQPEKIEEGQSAQGAAAYVVRYNSKLGISGIVGYRIEQFAAKVDKAGTLAGRSPLSTAGACIYFITSLMGEQKSLKSIAEVAGVSPGTVGTSYGLLLPAKETLVDPTWLQDGRSSLENLPHT